MPDHKIPYGDPQHGQLAEARSGSRQHGLRPTGSQNAGAEAADQDRALELRIVQELECAPEVRIPQDFAARVMASIPERAVRERQARLTAPIRVRRLGYTVAAVCLVVVAVAMLMLAPHTDQKTIYLALEWLLASQFWLLAVWLGVPRRS